jgi:oligopeptide transport system ATP-binding protein
VTQVPLLSVRGLTKHFPVRRGLLFDRRPTTVKAVDGVDLDVFPGETLGVVGESGCGKSTMARCLVRLLTPTAGSIEFEGRDISALSRNAVRPLRRDLQMVFQDPYASLNPRMRVGQIVGEPLDVHRIGTPDERRARVRDLLDLVGLSPEHHGRFPHEFSGGQRQRIGIARALAVRPKLIVCDEPVSALDVSVQAQILNLLKDLQEELGLTYIFIAHDLSVVKHISNRVMVMYLGRAVELAPAADLYRSPRHPYTGALLSAIPISDPGLRGQPTQVPPEGDVPNAIDPPHGCHFHPRCPRSQPGLCDIDDPRMRSLDTHGEVACHLPLDIASRPAT